MAEHFATQREQAEQRADLASRTDVGETDCSICEARGFLMLEERDDTGQTRSAFTWCSVCEHTGRVRLVQSARGFWAVAPTAAAEFVQGTREPDAPEVTFLGESAPEGFRYPKAGPRHGHEND